MPMKADMSESEFEIMEFLWSQKGDIGLKEIWQYFNKEKNKGWKRQTVRVFLLRLNDKGFINADINNEAGRYIYTPTCSREEYLQSITRNLLDKFFNGSISNFVSAFSGGRKIKKEEAELLKKFLEEDE